MTRRHMPVVLLIAAAIAVAGCNPFASGTTQDDQLIEMAPTPTPEITPTAQSLLIEPTILTSPSPSALEGTPPATTPSATPAPPSAEVRRAADGLSSKLASFRSALKMQGRPERAAKLQIELLAEAQKAENALKEDRSPAAAQVREAIANLRDGAAGDTFALEQAADTLRTVSGRDPTANGTPIAGTPGAALVTGSDAADLADGLRESIESYQQAQRERNTDNLLRKQAALVAEISQVESALAEDESPEAKQLKDATANIAKGLRGDSQALTKGFSAVQSMSGASASDGQENDLTTLAQNVATKLAAARDATDSSQPSELLRRQRELLDEVARAEQAMSGQSGPEAEAFKSALNAIRAGAGGDQAKLDSAAAQLQRLGSGTTGETAGNGGSEAVDPNKAQTLLSDRLSAMQQALDRGNNDDILKAHRDLVDAVEQVAPSVENGSSPGAENLRSAVEAIRGGLGGEIGKFDEAARHLGTTGGNGETGQATGSATGRSNGRPSGSPNATSVDVKPIADRIAGELNAVSRAQEQDDPEAAASARAEAEAELDRIDDELPENGPGAEKLRSVLNQARGALAGDEAKLEAARQALEDLR